MQVLFVGESEDAAALARRLDGDEVTVERWKTHAEGASDQIAAIARGLREFEQALGEGGPDAVLVASASSDSLAAVLVATKAGLPVACIEGFVAGGVNAELICHLSDTRLAAEPAAIVGWVRDA